jgi:small basic protein
LSFPHTPAASAPGTRSRRRRRANKIWWPIAGFLVGFGIASAAGQEGVPVFAADYLSVAVLAGLDSVFGGIRAGLERTFRSEIFLSGFFINMLLAVLLLYVGDRIGVRDIYLAAVVTLGGRIFLNLSVIRRHWLERHTVRAEK